MRRALPALVAALGVALAGCGPDCNRYCAKVAACEAAQTAANQPAIFTDFTDQPTCVTACDTVGAEKSHTIDCVIGHDCAVIAGGACDATGTAAP